MQLLTRVSTHLFQAALPPADSVHEGKLSDRLVNSLSLSYLFSDERPGEWTPRNETPTDPNSAAVGRSGAMHVRHG